MNWHLFRSDDPNTWPEVKCPLLVYDDKFCEFHICDWDHSLSKFVEAKLDLGAKVAHYWKECYYAYIGYVPDGYKVIKTTLCGVYPEKLCEYEDNGYCFDCPREIHCKYMQEVNEYALNDNKRIWKEFKE